MVTYFHQYQTSFLYSVVNGAIPMAPTLTCKQEGNSVALPLSTSPQSYWCDIGATASATNPAPGSTSTERWSNNNQGFAISGGGGTDTFTYYHQFLVTLSYSIISGGSPSAPAINGTAFGNASPGTLPSSPSPFWLDSGSNLNFPASLLSSSGSERWVTNATLNLVINSALTETMAYQHQYYADVESAASGGGSVSRPASGTTRRVSFTLLPLLSRAGVSEHGLGAASGSYSGNSTATDVEVEGPINETALFYPGLNLGVESGGSVTYSYGSTLGQASAGQRVLYVSPGTNVTLTANPTSFFYSFEGWAVSQTSGKSAIALVVSAPTSTEATFSYNVVTIGALGGAVVLVAAIAAIYFLRTRGRVSPLQTAPSTPVPTNLVLPTNDADLSRTFQHLSWRAANPNSA